MCVYVHNIYIIYIYMYYAYWYNDEDVMGYMT